MYMRYGLVADAIVPGSQGKNNIIGTFTNITAEGFPFNHPSLSLLVRIEGDASELGQHQMELRFVDADHRQIGETVSGGFEFTQDLRATEMSLTIQGLPFPKPGQYEFVITVDGRHIGTVPIGASLAR